MGQFVGQGSTTEHADLLDQLAEWAQNLPALGVATVQVVESRASTPNPDHHLTVVVTAPPQDLERVVDHLAIHRHDATSSRAG